MGPQLHGGATAIAAGVFTTLLSTALYYRSRWLRARNALDALRDAPPRVDLPGESLQHAVDAIAIEVERVSESQRFMAKLLAQRDEAFPQTVQERRARQLRDPTPVP